MGKAGLTLAGAKNVWLAIEKSTLKTFKDGINEKIGIITYEEKNNRAINFTIKTEPKRNDLPKYFRETQKFFYKKFHAKIEQTQNFFLCSMNADNWKISRDHKLWGVTDDSTAAKSALKRAKPGDMIVFRLNGIDFIAIWMVVDTPKNDPSGGPWKKENPNEFRDFKLQVKIHPFLGRRFKEPVKLSYPKGINKETGFITKMYMSGMVQITEAQYKIISKKLIEHNLKQLQNSKMMNLDKNKTFKIIDEKSAVSFIF